MKKIGLACRREKWEERTNINDQSIGIELVNQAECSIRQGSQYDYTNNMFFYFQTLIMLRLKIDYSSEGYSLQT
ncbi:MAG: hypothetical protein Ct9H90mP13_09030 [Pseudomonadota bacterium]|nr:MAG: hypothetical protein Ct9H90mP13_09030 [Pseudomonadota bacterium]